MGAKPADQISQDNSDYVVRNYHFRRAKQTSEANDGRGRFSSIASYPISGWLMDFGRNRSG